MASFAAEAQVCPGGGSNFSSAVSFDPAWIYGCNTGTSCNGGVAFDNRNACEPITSMDACAPAPICGVLGNSGSDIWFRFYASNATALISCFQNTSLVLGIQAFSGGLTCGSLVTIGCALSLGPSSGVQLRLNGLQPGTLYYFRIFGSANPVSQRTGLYCFCGSTGLGNYLILPVLINQVQAKVLNQTAAIRWRATTHDASHHFVLERSEDAIHYTEVQSATVSSPGVEQEYSLVDQPASNGTYYYRIKNAYADGRYDYSETVSVKINGLPAVALASNCVKDHLQVRSAGNLLAEIVDITGKPLKRYSLAAGNNMLAVADLRCGLYLLRCPKTGETQRFIVSR
ncbi:MAG TPA: hypothetical protein VL307_19035 [Chitinophagaceae bacterium]|nr:hypothetical protein [Chitinophagaceae bacterium]